MNVFIVDLVNQPGQLAKISEAIARKGINITGISGVTCGGGGAVALLTNDEPGTRKAFEDAGIRARELELVTTSIEDKPGTLAAVTKKLADAGVNIEAAMPTGMAGGKVSLALATDQPQKAREILGPRSGWGSASAEPGAARPGRWPVVDRDVDSAIRSGRGAVW